MKVLIVGIDGYLGWPLAQYLAARGHEIGGCDNFSRRRWVDEVGSQSIVPIAPFVPDRARVFCEQFGAMLFYEGDVCERAATEWMCKQFQPDAIVHLGE